jgi:hypothetical protein
VFKPRPNLQDGRIRGMGAERGQLFNRPTRTIHGQRIIDIDMAFFIAFVAGMNFYWLLILPTEIYLHIPARSVRVGLRNLGLG